MHILRWLAVAGAAATLSGCASRPQATLTTLNTADPKFNTPACLDIRARALGYDDKVGERLAIGLASGLLLGPFGIPIAAAADARQDEERRVFNREITLRCMTGGEAIVAEQDAKLQQLKEARRDE
jgi:hypothetical protein